jgi:hypothetical protein
MKKYKLVVITSILAASIVSIQSIAAEALPGKITKDSYGTKVIAVTQKQVDNAWKNFYQPNGFKNKINATSKYEIYGLEALYDDLEFDAETSALGRYANQYSSNWTEILYRCGEDCRADGSVAFWRDRKTGVITFYYPDTSAF